MAGLLYDHIDEDVSIQKNFHSKKAAWTQAGFFEALRMILSEKNTLFESLSDKLYTYPTLNNMLHSLLFTGKSITYNYYETAVNIASMFGFVKI